MLASPKRSSTVKKQAGRILLQLDRFGEAASELQSIPEEDQDWLTKLLIAKAILGRADKSQFPLASSLLQQGLAKASSSLERSHILAEMGQAHRKLGKIDRARDHFHEALNDNPYNHYALRKLASLETSEHRESELLALCKRLLDQQVNHPRLRAIYSVVLAKFGHMDEADQLRGLDTFFWQGRLNSQCGDPASTEFNQMLTDEILNNPSIRFENHRTASNHSWRVEELLVGETPALATLFQEIATEVKGYCNRLQQRSGECQAHPFVKSMPARAKIRPWSVITREAGYENWHIHDSGWLSGVYYVKVPNRRDRKSTAGAIEFGWPEHWLGEGASEELGNLTVYPDAGMLLLFPSHLHHRTYPHGLNEDRLCVSFDVVPE